MKSQKPSDVKARTVRNGSERRRWTSLWGSPWRKQTGFAGFLCAWLTLRRKTAEEMLSKVEEDEGTVEEGEEVDEGSAEVSGGSILLRIV